MCGIVGYIGGRDATPILVNGLRRLEYRGYDSAGVAVWDGEECRVVRCQGKLAGLESKLQQQPAPGNVGIGHTRWATHGRPSDDNAHPHRSGGVAVVHNGIIENHLALKQVLEAEGTTFSSETDTEIIAHLVARELKTADNLRQAVLATLRQLQGAYAVVVMSDKEPGTLVAAKSASPMVVGLGEGESFIASDITAILEETRDVIIIEEDEVVTVTAESVSLCDLDGNPIERAPQRVTWNATQAEKGGYRHFMLKEIFEQPRAIADTLAGRVDLSHGTVTLDDIELTATDFDRIVIIACGTSFHAGLVGEFLIESLARIPVEVDLGSEFRYRDPIIGARDLVVAISQSGETADTMAACREAKDKGAKILAIANVLGSAIPRLADWALYTHAGPEIGVASTKAFTTQLTALSLLAVELGLSSGALEEERARTILRDLAAAPQALKQVFEQADKIKRIARQYGSSTGFFFLGRGHQYPIALEGALKLKEISYIHAEGYAAGEMKHGPLALIDENLPVVVIAPRDELYDKTMSNLMAVKSREGKIIAIGTEGDNELAEIADEVLWIPRSQPQSETIYSTVLLQLLSYYVADFKGTDIDQPRNLAKSVTVE